MTLLDANARPIMPEMGPVRLVETPHPDVEAPRDTEPTPLAAVPANDDAPAPTVNGADLGPTLAAMGQFTKAQQIPGNPGAMGYLRLALIEFAKVSKHTVVEDVDYSIMTTPVVDPRMGEGKRIEVKDLTPAGEAFLNDWSGLISQLEEQTDKVRVQRLEQTVGYLSNMISQLGRAVDNLLIDVKKLERKVNKG